MKNLKIRTMVFTIFMTTVLICAGCGSQSSTSADNNGSTNTTKEKDASDLSTVSVHEDIWGNDDSVTRVTYTLDYSDEIWTLEDDNPEDDYFVLSSEEENLRVYMGINGELEQNATKTEEKMSGIDTTCYLFDNGEV
ncbi:MAG: hypothetical protein Q4B26_20075, partial [Eubacteriales bacterium]|nr:hypothetical protein [Eubacteriales bacterium]